LPLDKKYPHISYNSALTRGLSAPVLPDRNVRSPTAFGLLRRINTYLVRWARRKFKRLRAFKRAKRWWNGLMKRVPRLFAHWAWMPEF